MRMDCWFTLKNGSMDFYKKAIDFEFDGCLYKKVYATDRIIERSGEFVSVLDSRLMLKATDVQFTQTNLVVFMLDRHVVNMTVNAHVNCDYTYVISLFFKDHPKIEIKQAKFKPEYHTVRVGSLKIKDEGNYKIKHKSSYFEIVFNFDISKRI